ncbi:MULTISPECIES: hypothetical protein [Paraburkholderia]|uniref:hypothetical protein n=1 Tax=Paraburkholderia TaxID=1822464 RepID=UPI002ABDDAA5|nr:MULTISPECIES: hypothetical protein [Paraburkholderia]
MTKALELTLPLPVAVRDESPEGTFNSGLQAPLELEDELVFEARQKITLRCGKASITLYPNGKIALRGEYIVSDAAGINRIAGGQVELN